MKQIENRRRNRRIKLIGILITLSFLTIAGKAFYLQVHCSDWLSKKAANQVERNIIVRGERGRIIDTKGREIARSIDAPSIAVNPKLIKNTKETADKLGKVLKIDPRELQLRLIAPREFVWIKRQATPRDANTLKEMGIKGFLIVRENTRYYPKSTRAAQLIGFTGIDSVGLEGLEFKYDKILRGDEKKLTVRKDALGKQFDAIVRENRFDLCGNDLHLTIDLAIQYITEVALENAVTEFSAKSGMAVVMEPSTGAVLAMANVPLFNPNAFDRFPGEYFRNRTVTDPFEPGSTMKIFSAAAAIETGGCTPNTIFFCENGNYKVGEDIIHDTKSHGWLTLHKIIKYSSNIGAVKLSEMIGSESLYDTFSAFGFGEKTGINCPGETAGSLAHFTKWTDIDAGAISFGQGLSVSAVQLVSAVSAIANDGVLMRPYVVKSIISRNGEAVKTISPQKAEQAVSRRTAQTVKDMMLSVVKPGGTGTNAALDGYSVCGKTGTAQKVDRSGGYAKGKYMASFVGFVPYEKPRIAILVVIDEPQGSHYGGVVAAPVFKRIAKETLTYLDIPPTGTTERLTAELAVGETG